MPRGPQHARRATEAPSAAQRAWRARIEAAKGYMSVWILTPARELLQTYVRDISCLPELLWSENEAERTAQRRHLLHPGDCEYRLFGRHDARGVSMLWVPATLAAQHTAAAQVALNVTASRILLENNRVEAPPVDLHGRALTTYTHCFPSGPVVLFQTQAGQLANYGAEQLVEDWQLRYFADASVPSAAYRRLAHDRYQHYTQALAEFEKTLGNTPFLRDVITRYVGQLGPVTHWDRAQLVVLGAALLLLFGAEWERAAQWPFVRRL